MSRGRKRSLSPQNIKIGEFKFPKTDTSVCGIVQRINFQNFMCHGSFDWTPNKNINFLIGENGSGKSSILQGLVLGLLADSRHTKRYSKLGDFVQKGERKADIRITLRNEGEDAFKPDIYGPSIVFNRTIFDSGQTRFILLNQNKIILKDREAREEGKRILENFNINTDNPIVILQQEEAKELLKVESPRNLYEFFQKATLLEPCREQYEDAERHLMKIKETLKEKKKSLSEMGRDLDKTKRIVHELNKTKERDKEEQELEREYVVALMLEKRAEQEGISEEITQRSEKKGKAEEKLKSLNKEHAVLINEQIEQRDLMDIKNKTSEEEENKLRNIQIDTDSLKAQNNDLQKEIKHIEKLKNEVSGETEILKEEVDSLSSTQSLQIRQEKEQERLAELKSLDQKTADINEEIERRGHQRDALEKRVDEKEKYLKNLRIQKTHESTKIDELMRDLSDLEKQGNKKLAIIDRFAPNIAEEISTAARNGRFKKTPIGPVGKYIQLCEKSSQNESLKKLVETELSPSILKSYLCDNDDDKKVFWKIVQKVYGNQMKPKIFISKFLDKKHAVRKVEGGHTTLMDFIEISGEQKEEVVIFNFLVDQKGIESIVIKETQKEASLLCTRIENAPRNMNYCITWDFYRFFPPTKTTSYRSYFFDQTSTRILGCDMNSKIKEKTALINVSKEKVSKFSNEEDKISKLKGTIENDIEKLKIEIQKYREELQEMSKKKSKLKAEENSTDNLDALQAQLKEKNELFENLKTKLESKIKEKNDITVQLGDKHSEHNAVLKEVSNLREKLAPYEVKMRQIDGQISSKKKEIANQERVVKRWSKEIESSVGKFDAAKSEEKNLIANCKKIKASIDRVPSGSAAEISAKLRRIKENKKKTKKNGIDEETLHEEFFNKKKLYESTKKKLELELDWQVTLEDMNTKRQKLFLFIRKSITSMITLRFEQLSVQFQKQFGADQISIMIDHKKKELNLVFRNEDGDLVKKEISSLSGGEKSSAQMCLIAALWDNMNPPFRALDEWDVFLDAINRKEVSKTLLDFGLKQSDYQFFFISPQGAGDIEVSPAERNKVEIMEVVKS